MLTPARRSLPLLPQDREIIKALGLSEAEYRQFLHKLPDYSGLRPGDPVAFITIGAAVWPVLLKLAAGAALLGVAALLQPKQQNAADPARIETKELDGQDIVRSDRFSPKAGFGSIQNVVTIGSTIPLVYANREEIDGVIYGGVRVNSNLLWSKVNTEGGNQFFRGIFLLGEGDEENMEIDTNQIALGDNLINGYSLGLAQSTVGRLTVYYRSGGGRITSDDYVAGRIAASDPGNSQNNGAEDVYAINDIESRQWFPSFSQATKPSNQTTFGLFAPIGNNLTYRMNPIIRPMFKPNLKPQGTNGDVVVLCYPDLTVRVKREKESDNFEGHTFIEEVDGEEDATRYLTEGTVFQYVIKARTDALREYTAGPSDDGNLAGPEAVENCRDIGSAIAARSNTYDDRLIVGELYKIGTAICVCVDRKDEPYVSAADNQPIGGGTDVWAKFQVVEPGYVQSTQTARTPGFWAARNGTNTAHLFRVAIGGFVMQRATDHVEVTIRSSVGLRINGLMSFRDAETRDYADFQSCTWAWNQVFAAGEVVYSNQYQSNTYTAPEERYSFWRIGYRKASSDDEWVYTSDLFGIRSSSGEAIYNHMRIKLPTVDRYEFRYLPVSGWEIRRDFNVSKCYVLDPQLSGVPLVDAAGLKLEFRGEEVPVSSATFRLPIGTSREYLDIPYIEAVGGGDSYIDNYGRLAELFCYDQITVNLGQPEHEIVAVNLVIKNEADPGYFSMALMGMNLQAGANLRELSQLSAYVTKGLGGVHTFPEVLQDMLTSDRYGVGSILSPKQIDTDALAETAEWTRGRKYFFDGTVSERVNVRSWAVDRAPQFLLDQIIQNGRFSLRPALYFDRPEPITGLFTAGNILPNSFRLIYFDQQQRQPPRISVKWREERRSSEVGSPGLFPVVQEVTVREATTSGRAPLRTIDLSDFCTNEQHAIDVAKLACKSARQITHQVTFKTLPTEARLELGRCIRLGLETTLYETPANGCVDEEGLVRTWPELVDGTYQVLLWDGMTDAIQETSLTISDGRSAAVNTVFCVANRQAKVRTYKVSSIGFDEDGNVDVEAVSFPTLEDTGYSSLTVDWDNPEAWKIER